MDLSHLKTEWHPTKNGDLMFSKYLEMNYKYWWLGVCGHEWESSIYSRIGKRETSITELTGKSSGCSKCSILNILTMIDPILALEWHPTKNDELTPMQIAAKSRSIRIWWICSKGHEWKSSITNRMDKNEQCPRCLSSELCIGVNDLATTHPVFASEWHPTKNRELLPEQITASSTINIWWICSKGHEWKASTNKRKKDCYICKKNPRMLSSLLSAFDEFPILSAELHLTKNKLSKQITPRSVAPIWWLCEEGHEWKVSPYNRVRQDEGCPICKMAKYPILAAEWDATKNGELYKIKIESQRGVWWLGECGHEWKASPHSRIAYNKTCSVCSGSIALIGVTDFNTTHPEIAAQWHPNKNGKLLPSQVTAKFTNQYWFICPEGHERKSSPSQLIKETSCYICSSQKNFAEWHSTKNDDLLPDKIDLRSSTKVWWVCIQGHEWKASPLARNVRGKGCSICLNYDIFVTEWHPTRNEDLNPEKIITDSRTEYWWLGECGHQWQDSPEARTRDGWRACPICIPSRTLILGVNDLATAYPEIADEWHPTKNEGLTPQLVTVGKEPAVWWLGKCGHEWRTLVRNRTWGNGCPTCSGRKVLIGVNDLATTHPEIADEWHPTKNEGLTAQDFVPGSTKKIWWLGKCGHNWIAQILTRTMLGTGCGPCWAAAYRSKAEQTVHDYICALDENMQVIQSDRKTLNGKELDVYIPAKKIAVEFNGVYWHNENNKGQTAHYDKWLECRNKDIQLIQIWEDDWNKRSSQILSILSNIIGTIEDEEISAKELSVLIITPEEAEEFLNENHLQGYTPGSHYLGLVDEGVINVLHAVLVLNHEPEFGINLLEVIRYASRGNIAGAFSEILFYAIDKYSPESIFAIADNCGVDGILYKSAGFSEQEVILPDFMYMYRSQRHPKSDYSMERFRTDSALEWAEGFTEDELAYLNDIDRIWDAGKTVYRL